MATVLDPNNERGAILAAHAADGGLTWTCKVWSRTSAQHSNVMDCERLREILSALTRLNDCG